MNRESKLHGNSICTDCENLIKALDAEILSFNGKIEALKNFADNDCEGDSVEAMNAKCLELSAIIEKMIEGDREDIQDLKLLMEKVRGVYIDGEDVLEKMDTAGREANECYDKAESLSHVASMATFPWEKDYLNGLAGASRNQGESWDRIYGFWKGQAELYDEIDAETSTLFAKGIVYHRQAGAMMESFMQCGLNASNFTENGLRGIIKSGSTTINGEKEEKIYKFSHDYLLQNGFSKEQIEYLYRVKTELFSSLYITVHCSGDDCPAIIENMRGELNKVVVKYRFLVDDIEKRWNLSDEESIEILFILEKNQKLESLFGTYYHSQTDYYILLDGLVNDCDKWVEDNIPLLNTYERVSDWTEEDKRRVLTIYYWMYLYDSPATKYELEAGAATITEKDVGFDFEVIKERYNIIISGGKEDSTAKAVTENLFEDKSPDQERIDVINESVILSMDNLTLIKKTIGSFGWDYSDEEIENVNRILTEFGITDKYSIFCFLLCCYHETGKENVERTNEGKGLGNHYDSHNILISEKYDDRIKHGYEEYERGIGYLQVTGSATQKEAYEYLYANNYIKSKNQDDEYVDELSENPWAVSAWYWAKLPKTGDGLTLNEYVNKVVNSENNNFSYGLAYVCEAFVYGVVETNEEDTAYHNIARGANFGVEDDLIWYTDIEDKYTRIYSIVRPIERFEEFSEMYKKALEKLE